MTTPPIHIRPFERRDQAAARWLIVSGLGEHFGWVDEAANPDVDDIAAHFLAPGHVFVVAEVAGALAATGALLVDEEQRQGQMVRVSVGHEYRRRGVGRAIVVYLVEAARQRGLRRIIVETNRDWEDAQALYLGCGFAAFDRDAVSVYLQRVIVEEKRSTVEIRTVTEADAETYWTLRLRALREEPEAFGSSYEESKDRPVSEMAARLRAQAENPASFTLGAYEGSALLGMTTFVRETQEKVRHRGNIYAMYVAPEARGRGIARALLTEALDRARAQPGLDQVHLNVVTTNAPACQLYAALGFEVYGTEPRALKVADTYLDEYLMVLRLR